MHIVQLSQISPDQVILWSWGFITLNVTILYTWLVMAILVVGSWLVTRNLSSEINVSRWQHFLEVVISIIRGEISEMTKKGADHYIPLVGTLFLFICTSNVLAVVPGYVAPTSSITTTAALATCVFIAVPFYGISRNGILHYLKEYFQPTFIFFPFHVMGELSRTLALTVRLFGNIMSHEKVIGILLAVTPLLFPVVMQILGLLIGVIQAYIFAILSMVYIASALSAEEHQLFAILNRAVAVFDAVRNGGAPKAAGEPAVGASLLGGAVGLEVSPAFARPEARAVARWSF